MVEKELDLNKKNYKKFTVTILSLSLCMFVLLAFGTKTHSKESLKEVSSLEELKKQIKEELRVEFQRNIEEIVRKEVKAELAVYLAKLEELRADGQVAVLSPKVVDQLSKDIAGKASEMNQGNVDQLVSDIFVEELRQVSDEKLDQYVAAGGVSEKLTFNDGLTKAYSREEFLLAAADTTLGSSRESIDEDLSVTGGEGERPESIERTLRQKGSILLPKGTAQVEPSITWAHFSSNRISIDGLLLLDTIAVGEIATETIRRDIYVQSVGLKYGLLDNLQADIKIPFRGEFDRITDTNSSETTTHTSGFGDIDIGISRQVGWEDGWMPDLIASFGVKPPTGKDPYNKQIGLGTGHWSIRSGLVAAKSSDPAVVFGSLNYTHTLTRDDIDGLGEVDPGDTISYSLGTAIALSYQTAINFSFDHSLTFKTKTNGTEVNGSFLNIANFKTGFNWAINERASVDFGVSIGLTNDSPDVSVELRFPYTF